MPDEFAFEMPALAPEAAPLPPTGTPAPAPAPTPLSTAKPLFKEESDDPFARQLTRFTEQKGSQLNQALPQLGRSQGFNAELVDSFQAQKNYDPTGFDPGDIQGNQDRYAARETMGSTLEKSLNDFAYKFKGSFTGNFETYGQMAKSVWNMDLAKMDLDEDEKIKRYYADNQNELKNQIFQTAADDDRFFNKQFVKDLLGNSGFALGTFAAMGLELAADTAFEAITFGGATPIVAADAAGLGARLLSGARRLGEGFQLAGHTSEEITRAARLARGVEGGIEEAGQIGALGNKVSQAGSRTMRELLAQAKLDISTEEKSQKLYQQAGQLFEHLPLVGTLPKYASRMVAAGQAGESALKVAGIGLAGFRRSVVELNMAASEAAFESVTTYGDTLDRLVQQHRQNHGGEAPSNEQLAEMRQYASNASSANYQSNLALLLTSNKLQFGNLMSKFKPANKLLRDLTEETGEQFVKVSGKLVGEAGARGVGEQTTRLFEKGFAGTYGQLGKIASSFGKKEALWQGVKTFAKDAGKFEVAEGIQENLQETTAAGWRDYYVHAYAGTPQTLASAMGEGLKAQATQAGAKTFLMGALTGAIIHGPTKAAEAGIQALQGQAYKLSGGTDPVRSQRERTRADIKAVNALFVDPGKYVFNPQQLLFNEQVAASTQMSEAARSGKVYEWQDAKENSMLAVAKAARRLNAFGALTDQLHEVGKTFTPEQFRDAYDLDLQDTKYNTVAEFMGSIVKDLTSYVDEIDVVKRRLGPVIDPVRFGQDTSRFYGAIALNNALDKAVETVAMNKIKGGLAGKRAAEVVQNLNQIPGLGDTSQWLIDSLTRFDQHEAAQGSLSQNIAQLQENLREYDRSAANQGNAGIRYDAVMHEQVKKDLAQALDLQALLRQWDGYFDQRHEVQTEDGVERLVRSSTEFVGKDGALNDPEVMETFQQLVNAKARQNQTSATVKPVSYQNVSDGFDHVIDYIRLERDAREYLEAADKISSPAHFIAHWARINDGQFKAAVGQRLQQLTAEVSNSVLRQLTGINLNEAIAAMRTGEVSEAIRALAPEQVKRLRDIVLREDAETNAIVAVVQADPIYKNLQVVYLSESLGIGQHAYVNQLFGELDALVTAKMTEVLGAPEEALAPEPIPTDSTTDEAEAEANAAEPTEIAPDPANPDTETLDGRTAAEGLVRKVILLGLRATKADEQEIAELYEEHGEIMAELDQYMEDQVRIWQAWYDALPDESVKAQLDQAILDVRAETSAQPEAPALGVTPEPELQAGTTVSLSPVASLFSQVSSGPAVESNPAALVAPASTPTPTASAASLFAQTTSGPVVEVALVVPTPAIDTAPATATVTDTANRVIAPSTTPEEAEEIKDEFNLVSANRDFALGLLKGEETFLAAYLAQAQALLDEKNARNAKAKNPKEKLTTLSEFYTGGGKTVLNKLASTIGKEKTSLEAEPAPIVLTPATVTGPVAARFTDTSIMGIVRLTPADLTSFRARVATLWRTDAESSAKSGKFVEDTESTSTPFQSAVTEDDVLRELDQALACLL